MFSCQHRILNDKDKHSLDGDCFSSSSKLKSRVTLGGEFLSSVLCFLWNSCLIMACVLWVWGSVRSTLCVLIHTDHQPRLDAGDKCSDLVHWEDPEGSGGEGGGRGDRDREYM